MTDSRAQQLLEWCRSRLEELHGDADFVLALRALSGDASFRRYFRVRGEGGGGRDGNGRDGHGWCYIAVDAPPEREDCRPFIRISGVFAKAGVRTPAVIAADPEAGFMLLEDFGDDLYLPALRGCQKTKDEKRADALYRQAIDALVRIQAGVGGGDLKPYSREELRRELELFPEWFCQSLLKVTPDAAARRMLDDVFTVLEDAALAQPQVAVHRDYHSRNLMLLKTAADGPGILDFQDALTGAYTYDLVSLLRDCYIRWSDTLVQRWAGYYFAQAAAAGVVPAARSGELRRDFDLMGVQRHLKVLGVFARLYIRDKKSEYLADIPLVTAYILHAARPYPELRPLAAWFKETLLPVAPKKLHPSQP